ncbi:uncharacterized protein KGF55_004837 [Candida pseudojiufengensis]|uniref:uncharacterized protein n=1 Tax=Candida pseudojiufengensis TaxID=497109 RepID=UPI0022241A36|nr:uncharacterized protein KGF55_004837 [Candida pseudojiufengensis]KAI5960114.1 hypothetical protein KGF55_004837 [Candida pseudojiufengensis]
MSSHYRINNVENYFAWRHEVMTQFSMVTNFDKLPRLTDDNTLEFMTEFFPIFEGFDGIEKYFTSNSDELDFETLKIRGIRVPPGENKAEFMRIACELLDELFSQRLINENIIPSMMLQRFYPHKEILTTGDAFKYIQSLFSKLNSTKILKKLEELTKPFYENKSADSHMETLSLLQGFGYHIYNKLDQFLYKYPMLIIYFIGYREWGNLKRIVAQIILELFKEFIEHCEKGLEYKLPSVGEFEYRLHTHPNFPSDTSTIVKNSVLAIQKKEEKEAKRLKEEYELSRNRKFRNRSGGSGTTRGNFRQTRNDRFNFEQRHDGNFRSGTGYRGRNRGFRGRGNFRVGKPRRNRY